MDNKIIAAAREAGFSAENGRIFANCEISPAHVLCTNAASALYAIAYRQGLEDAAKLLETKREWKGGKWVSTLSPETASAIAAAIRALMKENTHG